MENESISSSSSSCSPQKLKNVVVSEEEKETTNHLEQGSPQEIVSERKILELPRFTLEVVRDETNHNCNFCPRSFSSRQALFGHLSAHPKERELEKQRKVIDSMFPYDTRPVPSGSSNGLSIGPFAVGAGAGSSSGSSSRSRIGFPLSMFPRPTLDCFLPRNTTSYGSSSRVPLTLNKYGSLALPKDDINLDLTLGPPGGSNNIIDNNPNSSLFTPVHPHVSKFNFVAGNPLDSLRGYIPPFRNTNLCHDLFSLQGNGSGSSHSKRLFSMEKNEAMMPPFVASQGATNLCNDLFSLQGHGSGSSHSKSLFSMGKNKAVVPPFATLQRTPGLFDDLFSLQENGSGSSYWKSLISMGKNKVTVPPFAPPRGTTNLLGGLVPLQKNGSGSSLISMAKNKAMVPPVAPDGTTSLFDDLFSVQGNGSGSSSHSKSLIAKGKRKVTEDDNNDIGMIRWMTKKKRSRRGRKLLKSL